MKYLPAMLLLAVLPMETLDAGQLGSEQIWLSNRTPAAELALNNDDYEDEFSDNPNHFNINEEGPCCPGADVRQSYFAIERIIPTVASGGITEYSVTLGGSFGFSSPVSESMDRVYITQVGFGTGDHFVRATEVVEGLQFDSTELVSPEVMGKTFIGIPVLTPTDHEGDTLVFQGSSSNGEFTLGDFSSPDLVQTPLDIPDLPTSVRDYYSAAELAGFAESDVPFTFRMQDTWIGDANLDGQFDSSDLLLVSQAGRYESGRIAKWSQGDWNRDQLFTSADLTAALADGGYEQGSRASHVVRAVPEPAHGLIAMLGILLGATHYRGKSSEDC